VCGSPCSNLVSYSVTHTDVQRCESLQFDSNSQNIKGNGKSNKITYRVAPSERHKEANFKSACTVNDMRYAMFEAKG
jgi:hypothetical protein